MINNKSVFVIGTMLVLLPTLSLNIPSKIVIAQQQEEETSMMSMDKMMQNMTGEQLSKKIMQAIMDDIKKENPMHADIIDKIPSMNLEETVKNLFAVEDMEQLLKMHAEDLVKGESMGSNQTTTTK